MNASNRSCAESTPFYGRAQPTDGRDERLDCKSMGGQAKRPKYVSLRMRRILAENVKARMAIRYDGEPDIVKALAEACGVSRSTIQRIITPGAVGASIDTIDQLAKALQCEPYELLVPPSRRPPRGGSGTGRLASVTAL